jgi:hypothetical protein
LQRLAVVIVDPACDCCSVLDPSSRRFSQQGFVNPEPFGKDLVSGGKLCLCNTNGPAW